MAFYNDMKTCLSSIELKFNRSCSLPGASLVYISQYGYPGVETEHFLRLIFMEDVNRIAISLMTVYNSASTFTNFFPLSSKAIFPFVH